MALKVMIVRHGEKPPVKHQPPFGTTVDGEQDWESLINPGWLRAGGLALLFDPRAGWALPAALATPAQLYASKPRDSADADSDGDKEGSKSKRPLETITPLSQRLGHAINLDFGKGDEKQLVDAVLKQAGPVLISWQHERIPDISNRLVGANPPAGGIPQKWPGKRFDLVWVFDAPASAGQPWTFTQVPQLILPGDSSQPIT
ncbi:MAG TPA: histidine phosphatase family protein [Reyranella sp.]|nr:histidine phosphatase family protein [Reyranella sp.]